VIYNWIIYELVDFYHGLFSNWKRFAKCDGFLFFHKQNTNLFLKLKKSSNKKRIYFDKLKQQQNKKIKR